MFILWKDAYRRCFRSILPLNLWKGVKIMLDKIALLLTIIGAVNWGLIGIFQFDLVAYIFGGQGALVSRIIYTLVGAAGLWCISLLFRDRDMVKD